MIHFTEKVICNSSHVVFSVYNACVKKSPIFISFKHNVEVLGILSDDVETDSVAPGENLKIRLKGIEEEEILPGFILCDANNLCHSGRTFDAQVNITVEALGISHVWLNLLLS